MPATAEHDRDGVEWGDAHAAIHIESAAEQKDSERESKDDRAGRHSCEDVCWKCFAPHPAEEIGEVSDEKHVGQRPETDKITPFPEDKEQEDSVNQQRAGAVGDAESTGKLQIEECEGVHSEIDIDEHGDRESHQKDSGHHNGKMPARRAPVQTKLHDFIPPGNHNKSEGQGLQSIICRIWRE